MNKIVFPLELEMKGPQVGDLQSALLLFLDRRAILANINEEARKEQSVALQREHAKENFGKTTNNLVSIFQAERRLDVREMGKVDEATAGAMNDLLRQWGLLEQPARERPYVVSGQVKQNNGLPLKGVTVRAFHILENDSDFIRLGEDTTDAEGRYTIRYEMPEGLDNIRLGVRVFDSNGNQLIQSDLIRKAKPLEIVNLIVPSIEIAAFQVEGKIASRNSPGIGGLWIQIVDRAVGEVVQLGEKTKTDDNGAYRVSFSDTDLRRRGKDRPDLQARVFAGEKLIGTSEVRYNASNRETLNILLEEDAITALRSEHETLASAISVHFKGKLQDLKETDDQPDITYLANKTGWDARAVALASLASQFSAKTADARGVAGIEPEFFYALFRAGLPANESAIYQIDSKTAESIWGRAISQGVIPVELKNKIPNAIEQLQRLSAQKALDTPALVGVSSLKDMLSASLKPELHEKFAVLYTRHRSDMTRFWEEAGKVFEKPIVDRLKLDGKLFSMTLNNDKLIIELHKACELNGLTLTDTRQLVGLGYYRTKTWEEKFAGCPVPPEIIGKDDAEKRHRYNEFLAAQVRISYPTDVVADMVNLRSTPLMDVGSKDAVYAFLTKHRNFEMGMQPIEQYVAKNNSAIEPQVLKEIKRIERIYQITPSDDAMNKLLEMGVDSAFAVTRYDRNEFVLAFKDHVGGEENAGLIHAKSQQVHNAVLNIAVSYLTASVAFGIGGHSLPGIINSLPKGSAHNAAYASDIIAYPTLETLFGEMDYCPCEHCRSFLSPAAYLVDLLKFIDLRLKNDRGQELPKTYKLENPLDVLLERRPDIQHIPLTCENTNLPLPYIDLVNETLEYYITNNLSLKNYAGHTTDDTITSEELLANPQFVSERAYEILNPKTDETAILLPPTPPLPFHQPLENLRRYFKRFEAPLPAVMRDLRRNDSLERASDNEYGWLDILIEELLISRTEYALLTNRKIPFKQLFGYPSSTPLPRIHGGYLFNVELKFASELDKSEVSNGLSDKFKDNGETLIPPIQVKVEKIGHQWTIIDNANNEYSLWRNSRQINISLPGLVNAKFLARRMNISYEELVEILKTRFINPSSVLIPKLEKLGYNNLIPKLENLGLSFKDIQDFKDKKLTEEKLNALLPKGIDKSQYGGNVGTWILTNYDSIIKNIGLTFQTIKDFIENNLPQSAFRKLISIDEIDITAFGGQSGMATDEKFKLIEAWLHNNYSKIRILILLSDPTNSGDICNFDKLELRYAEPDNKTNKIREFDLIKLFRFIRLWKKLGWSIEQTDKAITALYPPKEVPVPDDKDEDNLERLDKGFIILLPRLGVIKRIMDELKLKPKKDLLPLLACFAEIDTDGAKSLYRGMFLSPTLLKQDAAFKDNGYGEFLRDNAQKLIAHAETLRGTFNMTSDEFSRILQALHFDTDSAEVEYKHTQPTLEKAILDAAPGISYNDVRKRLSYTGVLSIATCESLKKIIGVSTEFKTAVDSLYAANQKALTSLTLENISAVFRRGWLARKLKLSVREFLLLIKFTGLDPFTMLNLADPPILRLHDLAERLRAASIKPVQALFLIWNQDISGKSMPNDSEILGFARGLRSAFSAINSEFALVNDPDGKIAHERMALVYGNEATERFFGLLGNTLITSVPLDRAKVDLSTKAPCIRGEADKRTTVSYSHHQAELEEKIVKAATGLISYDHAKKRLSFNGTLTVDIRDAIKAVEGATDGFKAAVDNLYVENQKVIKANLEQAILDAASGSIGYDDAKKEISFIGILTIESRDALKAVSVATDEFKVAIDRLYVENQKVIKANLEQIIADAAPGLISYDDFNKQLSFAGIFAESTKKILKEKANDALTQKVISREDFIAFVASIDKLYNNNKNIIDPFFSRYPELRTLYDAYDFFGHLSTSVDYQQAQALLSKEVTKISGDRLSYYPNYYDPKKSYISCSGVLTKAIRDAIKDAAGSGDLKKAVETLYIENQKSIQDFFNNHKDLDDSKQRDAYLAADNIPEKMRSVLLASFLPDLKHRHKCQDALQAICEAAQVDIAFSSVIMDNLLDENAPSDRRYILHSVNDMAKPAISDLIAMETPGISVDQGIWRGYLEVPENGHYNFYVETDENAKISEFKFDGSSITPAQQGKVWRISVPGELRTGTLYPVDMKIENMKDKFIVRWEAKGRGKEIIPEYNLYSATDIDNLRATYIRFFKAASIAKTLKLTAAETAYLVSHADYQISNEGWLNKLTVKGSPDEAILDKLLKAFNAMIDFSRLKSELSPDDERLLAVLKDPTAKMQNDESLLKSLTRWETDSIDSLLARFANAKDGDRNSLKDLSLFFRVYNAYYWVKTFGIPASVLIKAATNEPDAGTIRNLQAALRARYEMSDWLSILKPINDEMRGLQRNALVAYILHQMRSNPATSHIDTPEKLFEYFLMDVQMEPCMQTSRIRHALSSVQLFIERCLMNLETRVAPDSIKPNRWNWMKRYRVWEANRKVFLYPENWLEPELRDDQSPFFKEAMSELLQGDITEDRAAEVLLNYLAKLEEVAKLEPCGIYYVEDDPNTKAMDSITHVVARTAGANRKYYYRCCDGGCWTPWEQIKLDIEDDPVIPVVWKNRLFLFWFRILKQARVDPKEISNQPAKKEDEVPVLGIDTEKGEPIYSSREKTLAEVSLTYAKDRAKENASEDAKITVQAVLCWSEFFNGRWQPTRTSDINKPANLGDCLPNDFNRSELRVAVLEQDNILKIKISSTNLGGSVYELYNTYSLPVIHKDNTEAICSNRKLSTDNIFTIEYNLPLSIFRSTIPNARTIAPCHPLKYPWDAPFFYEDSRNVFYVTTPKHIDKIPDSSGYGLEKHPNVGPYDEIPDPVGRRDWPEIDIRTRILEDLNSSIRRAKASGVIDRSPIIRFVTEDVFVERVIDTLETVQFGDKEIGPAGSLMKTIQKR